MLRELQEKIEVRLSQNNKHWGQRSVQERKKVEETIPLKGKGNVNFTLRLCNVNCKMQVVNKAK